MYILLLVTLLRRQLFYNIVRVFPRQRHILGMTASGKDFTRAVTKVD